MTTMNAADLLGANSGEIKVGKNADIISMYHNPLEDIGALRGVQFVMKDGKTYKEKGKFVWETPRVLNNPRRKQARGNMLRQN